MQLSPGELKGARAGPRASGFPSLAARDRGRIPRARHTGGIACFFGIVAGIFELMGISLPPIGGRSSVLAVSGQDQGGAGRYGEEGSGGYEAGERRHTGARFFFCRSREWGRLPLRGRTVPCRWSTHSHFFPPRLIVDGIAGGRAAAWGQKCL